MQEVEILQSEIASLKNTIGVLIEEIAQLKAENLRLKNEVIAAALPKKKITPAQIAVSQENIQKLMEGLKGVLHRNASGRKYSTVAIQMLTLHNAGPAAAKDLCSASGLSYQ